MVAFDRQTVVRALAALGRRHREVLVLRYYLELSVDQTAQTLGISSGTVKSYAARGLDRLREQLQREDTP